MVEASGAVPKEAGSRLGLVHWSRNLDDGVTCIYHNMCISIDLYADFDILHMRILLT